MAERPHVEAWTDERLDAAFRALVPDAAPPGLEDRVADGLDDRPSRRWLAIPGLAAAGLVAVVLAAVVAPALLRGPLSLGTIDVREGAPGTKVFDAGEFSFAFPADWTVTETTTSFSGGSSLAVLGTLPPDPRCLAGRADINCLSEQRIEPGTTRVWVGTGAYRSGSILDPGDIDGTTTAITVDGMPARLDQFTVSAVDYYRSDLSLRLEVARPSGFGQVVTIELRAREPEVDAARAAMDAIRGSFRFASPLPALPADDAAGLDVARRVLAESDAYLRKVIGTGSGATPYSCQPADPGVVVDATVGYTFTERLGREGTASCSWTIERGGERFWVLTVHADEEPTIRTETLLVDADGEVLGRKVDELHVGTATAAPQAALPPVNTVLGLPVITVEQALTVLDGDPGDRELAVEGWWPGDPGAECPAPAGADRAPILPRCPDTLRFLTAQREPLIDVGANQVTAESPTSPHLVLLLRDGAEVPPGSLPTEGGVDPMPVVVVGHVADHRAPLCELASRALCERSFVVDAMLRAIDTIQPIHLDDVGDLEPVGTESIVVDLARAFARSRETLGDAELRLVAVLRLSPEALARVEPALADPATGMHPTGVTWLVKLLVPAGSGSRVETIAIPDAAYPAAGALGDGVTVYFPTRDGVVSMTGIN